MDLTDPVIIGLFVLVFLLIILLTIKFRYHQYDSSQYVLFYRHGMLLSQKRGGAYFVLPILDSLVVIDSNKQYYSVPVEVARIQSSHHLQISCVVHIVYQVIDPVTFYQNGFVPDQANYYKDEVIYPTTTSVLRDLTQSYVQRYLQTMSADEISQDRLVSSLRSKLEKIVADMSIRIDQVQLSDLQINP